jgi:formate dehydrogenase major subunit
MLVLPCLGRTEKDVRRAGWQGVTVEDSMSSVHLSVGRNEPASEHLRSEPWIVCRIAEATLGSQPEGSRIDWDAMAEDYTVIRRHIGHVVPGCDAYDEKVKRPGGFVLPHAPRDTRTFETPSGRAEFGVSPLEVLEVPEGHLLLQTLRSHDQFNTTIYGHDDRYRGLAGGRHVVMVHPDDLAHLGLEPEQVVDVVSVWEDGSERVARDYRLVSYPTPRGCAAAYYPECNVLVPPRVEVGRRAVRAARHHHLARCQWRRQGRLRPRAPQQRAAEAPQLSVAATTDGGGERPRLRSVGRPPPTALRRPAAAGRRGRRQMP